MNCFREPTLKETYARIESMSQLMRHVRDLDDYDRSNGITGHLKYGGGDKIVHRIFTGEKMGH